MLKAPRWAIITCQITAEHGLVQLKIARIGIGSAEPGISAAERNSVHRECDGRIMARTWLVDALTDMDFIADRRDSDCILQPIECGVPGRAVAPGWRVIIDVENVCTRSS